MRINDDDRVRARAGKEPVVGDRLGQPERHERFGLRVAPGHQGADGFDRVERVGEVAWPAPEATLVAEPTEAGGRQAVRVGGAARCMGRWEEDPLEVAEIP